MSTVSDMVDIWQTPLSPAELIDDYSGVVHEVQVDDLEYHLSWSSLSIFIFISRCHPFVLERLYCIHSFYTFDSIYTSQSL